MVLAAVTAPRRWFRDDARTTLVVDALHPLQPRHVGSPRTAVDREQPRRRRLQQSWPLTLLIVGFPLWWALGLSNILPVLVAIPMAHQMIRSRPIKIPRGFGWWLLFAIWVAASVLMLTVDAPGAVPGGGAGRLMVFGYRALWYLACTIALLWVGNADLRSVPTRRVCRLLGWMFVVTVLGGLLGMIAPRFEITSLVEVLLPRSLASNGFVNGLVHPEAATLTGFLGREEYRPIAPFSFANSWGANLSLFLPFFLISWFGKDSGWRRVVAPVVLALAAAPIVYSMNRGLWAALAVGLALVAARAALRGSVKVLVATILAVGLVATALAATPLADRLAERLDTAHSNDRRGQLLTQTVTSTAEGSPVLGFGSTRDVQGSFASIAGGATPGCPACGVPPLGTQGHLWLVIFSQGLVGALFFLAFFLSRARHHWRSRTPLEAAGMVVLIFLGIEIFIYDTLGMPLFTVMLALGMLWREHPDPPATVTTLDDVVARARRGAPLVAGLAALGAAGGMYVAVEQPPVYAADVSLFLAEAPLYLDERTGTEDASGKTTVDTEAALVLSVRTMDHLAQQVGALDARLRDRIHVTAPPNTRILNVEYQDPDRARAGQVADALAESYLGSRKEYLDQRRDQVLRDLKEQMAEIQAVGAATVLTETQVRRAIDNLTLASTEAGEVIAAARTQRVEPHPEVPITSGLLLGGLVGVALLTAAGRGPTRPGERGREPAGAQTARQRTSRLVRRVLPSGRYRPARPLHRLEETS